MNEHYVTCNHGLRLISQFEGKDRLVARLCEGGRYELGKGITFYLDGSPVKAGDTCTEEQADAMFRNALQRFELAVMAHVKVPLTQHQFSALVAFFYNVGEANAAGSTLLRMVNANRFYDAAAAFGMWVYATKDGHKQALRGLLRRRYAEACLFLSYDWEDACSDDAIALQRRAPKSLPGTDAVVYKTPFSDVLAVAQRYPLAEVLVVESLRTFPVEEIALEPVAPLTLDEYEGQADEFLLDKPAPALEPEAVTSKGVGTAGLAPATVPIPTPIPEAASVSDGPAVTGKASQPIDVSPKPPAGAPPVQAPAAPPPKLPDGPETESLKSLVKSRRFWGQAIHSFGHLFTGFGMTTTPGPLATGFGKLHGVVVTNPVLFELSITLAVLMTGYLMVVGGAWLRKWGEKTSKGRPLGTSKEVALAKPPPT